MRIMKAANNIELIVTRDFSKTPGPRYEDEGNFSGKRFREECLLPRFKEALKKGWGLTVDLDGTAGYGTSFLEEAFGGLIRNEKLSLKDIQRTIHFKSEEEPYLIDDINKYMEDAENERQ